MAVPSCVDDCGSQTIQNMFLYSYFFCIYNKNVAEPVIQILVSENCNNVISNEEVFFLDTHQISKTEKAVEMILSFSCDARLKHVY